MRNRINRMKTYRMQKQASSAKLIFIPASNEPSDCLQAFGDCREGQIPCTLGRVFDWLAACICEGTEQIQKNIEF